MSKRILSGKIISDKMQKTVVVRVERMKEHTKYRKKYKASKNYKAHVENSDYFGGEADKTNLLYKVGDEVLIEECTPISKDKKWKVIKKVTSRTEELPENTEE